MKSAIFRIRWFLTLSVSVLSISLAISQTIPGNGIYVDPSRFALPVPAVQQTFALSERPLGYAAYNPITDNQGNSYIRIGGYRVKGSPYLFSQNVHGYIFLTKNNGVATELAYDTYNQQLQFYIPETQQTGTEKLEDVDSFYISKDENTVKQNMVFINARIIDPSKKYFLQKLVGGNKYSLYKLNKSELQIPSDNYVESDLREFDLEQQYFYLEKGGKALKKIKPSFRFLKNEFKDVTIDNMVNDAELSNDPDIALQMFFLKLDDK